MVHSMLETSDARAQLMAEEIFETLDLKQIKRHMVQFELMHESVGGVL